MDETIHNGQLVSISLYGTYRIFAGSMENKTLHNVVSYHPFENASTRDHKIIPHFYTSIIETYSGIIVTLNYKCLV